MSDVLNPIKSIIDSLKINSDLKPCNIPVCTFLSVTLIIIFLLYTFSIIKEVPCEKNLKSIFLSNFVHTNVYHLLTNLFSFYSIAYVEQKLGPKTFFGLIIFLLIFNTIFEFIVHSINKNIPCSIGFSGILFGLITYEFVSSKGKEIDIRILLSILLKTLIPSIQDKKASLLGHMVGAISGIIGGIIYSNYKI